MRDQTIYTPVSIPEASTRSIRRSSAAPNRRRATSAARPSAANLAIAVTPRLSIVPDLRYDYGSIGDEINNALRVSVRLQWRF